VLEFVLSVLLVTTAQPGLPADGAAALTSQAERLQRREPLRARSLYERAARQGYAPAQAALGILLFKEGDRAGALPWLKQAAEAGEPRALLIYGTAMFNGDGVAPDRRAGYAMVRRAAAQGSSEARATQSEMELVMPELERDLSSGTAGGTESKAAAPAAIRTIGKQASSRQRSKAAPPTPGPWRIQLGAFRQPGAGQALFAQLAPRLPGKLPAYVAGGSLLRLQVGPYASLAEAAAACRSLAGRACVPVRVR
jgi:cell division septation protein DedD